MCLTCVVNGDRLVKLLDWIASIAQEGILFAKILFNQVSHPLKYIHNGIILYTNQYYH